MAEREQGGPIISVIRYVFALLLVFGWLFTSAVTIAQEGFSALRGVVTDPSGAVVPGTAIKVTDGSTSLQVRSVMSDKQGEFEIPDLKPGTYRLEFTKQGFKTFLATDVILDAGHIRRLDVKLALAAQENEVMEVRAGAQLIDTEGGTLQAEFTSKEFLNNPLVQSYPNAFALFQTLPGVQGQGWGLMVNGANFDNIAQELDGVASDRYGEQKNNINFYQEATVTTMNSSASSARPAAYNLTSKRGSDAFHGAIHYQRLDSAFDSAQPPIPPKSAGINPKPHGIQHDAQAELSGPIPIGKLKNKAFFYYSWFLQRVPNHQPESATVPSAAMLAGNLGELCPSGFNSSGLCNAYVSNGNKNPSNHFNFQIIDPLTGNPFPNNVIPANRLSSVAIGAASLYPAPDIAGIGSGFANANYVWNHAYTTGQVFTDYYKGDWQHLRLDYNLTSKNAIYLVGTQRKTPYDWPGPLPDLYGSHIRNEWQGTLRDIHTFSSTLTNSAAFSLSRDVQVAGEPQIGQQPHGQDFIQKVGLEGVNPSGYNTVGIPSFSFGGPGFSTANSTASPTSLYQQTGFLWDNATDWTINDDVTWQKGRHVLTFGGTFQHVWNAKDSNTSNGPDYGQFSFDGRYSGYNFADFLLGYPNWIERSDPLVNRVMTLNVFGAYASDTFKVTPKLTLDYGLRWDYEGTKHFEDGLVYNYDVANNQIIVPAEHLKDINPAFPALTQYTYTDSSRETITTPSVPIVAGHPQPRPDMGNWGPRVAVAYRLPGNMVLRGGYGLYWQRYSRGHVGAQEAFGGPFQRLSQGFSAPTFTAPGAPPFQFPAPFPGAGSSTNPDSIGNRSQWLSSYPKQWHNGSIHNFNVTLEKEIAHLGLRASYIGSRTEHQVWEWWGEDSKLGNMTPYSELLLPQYWLGGVGQFLRGGKSTYNAFQFEVKKKQGFLTLDASYNYASDLSNVDNLDSPDPTTLYSKWAPNGADTRNRVTVRSVWTLPFGRGKRYLGNIPKPLNQIVGGWTVETISYFASGWLFGPYFCGSDYANANQYCGTPDVIPGATPYLPDGKRTNDRWFNTAVFTCADPNGNCGTGTSTPFAYQQLGAFMIPGCTPSDPLCLNTQQQVVGRFGNAPYNSLHGDPLNVHHLSFSKTFGLTEKLHMTYSAMISNVFNRPHYYNPDGTITDYGVNGGGCVGHISTWGCGYSENGFEYNHAGFRSIAMKLRFEF